MVGLSSTSGIGTGGSKNTGAYICIPGNGRDITLGRYTQGAVGGYVSLGISMGVELTIAPSATDFKDIEGFSLIAGGSGKIPVGSAGLEIGYNPQAKGVLAKLKSATISVTFSTGASLLPGEGHVFSADTQQIGQPINISEKIEEIELKVNNLIKENKFDELKQYISDLYIQHMEKQ